jgi:hypothetical protein
MERTTILQGFALLNKEKRYHQAAVVEKLNFLGIKISKAGFNNILHGKAVKPITLLDVSKGIRELVEAEMGFTWDGEHFTDRKTTGWQPREVEKWAPDAPSFIIRPGLTFHAEGRLNITQKVDFFKDAQEEVIEFGVTLNTFSQYFTSRSDFEFKSPMLALLEKGVNFKCYLLNPDCSEARVYFNDSKAKQGDEQKIRDSIDRLAEVRKEFGQHKTPGKFEVFTYKRIPTIYILSVDGYGNGGRLMASHYIYNEPRAKCPVIAVHNNKPNSMLFKRYRDSLYKLIENAKPLP